MKTVTITEEEFTTACALVLAQTTQNMQVAHCLAHILGLLGEVLFNGKEVLFQ